MEDVAIARVIAAEFFPRDDPDVALSLRFFSLLDAPGLVEVFGRGPAQEGDGLAVGRPGRRRGPFGQVGQRSGLASGERQQVELGRLRLPVLLGGPGEDQPGPVRRPSGRGVVRAVGQPPRLDSPVPGRDRDEPDGGHVIVLVGVDRDLHERHPRTVGRDPGIGRPGEPHQILGGDGTLRPLRPALRPAPPPASRAQERESRHGGVCESSDVTFNKRFSSSPKPSQS